MHAGTAGTDVGNRWYLISLFALIGLTVFVVLYRILAGTGRQARPKPEPSNLAAKSDLSKSPVASHRR